MANSSPTPERQTMMISKDILRTLLLLVALLSVPSLGRSNHGTSFYALGSWSFGTSNDIKMDSFPSRDWSTASSWVKHPSSRPPPNSNDNMETTATMVASSNGSNNNSNQQPEKAMTLVAGLKTKRFARLLPGRHKASTAPSPSQEQQHEETTTPSNDMERIKVGAAQPLIPTDVWEQLSAEAYDDPAVIDHLAQTGLLMVNQHNNNGWVEWKESIPANLDSILDEGGIEVFTGSTLQPGFGSEVPWIKSISRLPFSPSEMAELMMDSTRVQSYNSLSLGRDDVQVLAADEPTQGTKIVRNVVQLPVTNNKVESITLLHTRQLENGAHLLVSRAVPSLYSEKMAKGYTLLGVNLFEPIPNCPDECRMTAISHVYSPGVPLMVAGKVGVKSAKNFVKDIRALLVPAS